MKGFAVRNWQKFQHYRDRNPPWIKVYTELLDNAEFLALPEASNGLLMACCLLAAKRGNRIPTETKALKVLLGVTGKLYLAELVAGGWLEEVELHDAASKVASNPSSTDASNLASTDASNLASASCASAPSREGETETEAEDIPTTPARVGSIVLPLDAGGQFLAQVPPAKRHTWEQTLRGWLDGLGYAGGKAADPDDVAVGLLEYLTCTAPHERDFHPRHVVKFVEAARMRRTTPQPGVRRLPSNGAESIAEQALRVATTFGGITGGQVA